MPDMITLHRRPVLATILAAAAGATAQSTPDDSSTSDLRGAPGTWRTVLDGVMGGRSTGRVQPAADGTIAFTGTLSLENNGGFSSMRRPLDGAQLAATTGLVLECRGDGRTYNFDLRTSNVRRMASGYRKEFATVDGEWIEVRLPFDEFRLQSFGRYIRGAAPLDPAKVESLGITLSDKQAGAFRLEIRAIRATANDSPKTLTAGISPRRPMAATGSADAAGATSIEDARRLAAEAGLTTLLAAVDAAALAVPRAPITIFAPTNDAFAALPKAELARLLEPRNRASLRRVLGLHVVPGRVPASALLAGARLESLAGGRIEVAVRDGRLTLRDGIAIVATDLQAGNVTIHQIDRVILPSAAPETAADDVAAAIAALDPRESAIAVYVAAIDRGAPLFNAGNIAACTAVYETAVDAMLLLGGRDLGDAVFERLLASRRDAAREGSTRQRAWLLREALDDAAGTLQRAIAAGPAPDRPRR